MNRFYGNIESSDEGQEVLSNGLEYCGKDRIQWAGGMIAGQDDV